MTSDFWTTLDQLVESSDITIDRPKGSRHPRYHHLVYPLDYGFLEETGAIDGGGVDVWIGSLPGRSVVGILASVDLAKRDSEIKILLGCTDDDVTAVLDTVNTGSQAATFIRRPE